MQRKQLNIRISEELHKKAKIVAILKGKTLNDYIEEAINSALSEDNSISQAVDISERRSNNKINSKNSPKISKRRSKKSKK